MKKSYILIGIFLVFIILITTIGSFIITGNAQLEEEKDVLLVQSNKELYFNVYGYSIDNPNVIINPYGNSPLTAIVMFETEEYSNVELIIKSKNGTEDIKYKFDKDKYHIIPIYGLYADYNNTIVIKSENKEKTINIKTDKLPDDFKYTHEIVNKNFTFYNSNYPYAIDSKGDVRWYLNRHYYGNITVFDNASIIIGSDRYDDDGNTVSFYKMNLLGKIYNEYILEEGYYGYNTMHDGNILVLSKKLLLIDIQTGEIISEYIDNNNFDYLGVDKNNFIVGKDNIFYEVSNGSLKKIKYSFSLNNYSFYTNVSNYKIIPNNRFGKLNITPTSSEKIALINYENVKSLDNIVLVKEFDRLKVINNNDESVYIIFDKFLDKKTYEITDSLYINFTGFNGKYTIYYKIGSNVYKTDYFIEV